MIRTSLVCLLVAATCGLAVAQRPRLGVRVHPSSVLVSDVENGSVSSLGGLRVGDVIVRCGSRDVDTIEDVIEWLGSLGSGAKETIIVRRGNEEKSLSMSFGEGDARLGIEATGGLSVQAVTEGSIAAKAGIKAGDVIVGFGGAEIETFDSLRAALADVDAGEEVSIRVNRGGKESELWASFVGGARRDEGDRPGERGGDRRRGNGPPRGIPGLPGMEALGSLMEVGAVQGDLGAAIASLRKMNDPALAAVIEQLESVHGRLAKVAGAVKGIKDMAEGFMGGMEGLDEAFGGGMPDLAEIQERLQELMSDGLSLEKIQKIIAEEFPGVMLEMGGGMDDDAPPAPEKDDDR